jgi:hypothetical protein
MIATKNTVKCWTGYTNLEKFADDYLSRGWSVIPVQHKGKQPTLKDWTQSQITLDTLDKHFKAEPRNIGICLGEASGGLVDVDLDVPAVQPHTGSTFARGSIGENPIATRRNPPARA